MDARVEKGIPLPRALGGSARGGVSKWPWAQMEPGDSFFAAGYVQSTQQRLGQELLMRAGAGTRVLPGSKWASRLLTENGVRGVRVWRVA